MTNSIKSSGKRNICCNILEKRLL
uniref:Uncharacterized protein n=1 Tax=Lepeophtheirus salmonis TaxID=72036 RepID=A0A0K2TW99_LEPSM